MHHMIADVLSNQLRSLYTYNKEMIFDNRENVIFRAVLRLATNDIDLFFCVEWDVNGFIWFRHDTRKSGEGLAFFTSLSEELRDEVRYAHGNFPIYDDENREIKFGSRHYFFNDVIEKGIVRALRDFNVPKEYFFVDGWKFRIKE